MMTDLIARKFQHSQQVLTPGKCDAPSPLVGERRGAVGDPVELERSEPHEFSQLTSLGLPSRTGSFTQEKFLEVESKLSRKETVEMTERQSQLGSDLDPCDCKIAQPQPEKRKRFKYVFLTNISK